MKNSKYLALAAVVAVAGMSVSSVFAAEPIDTNITTDTVQVRESAPEWAGQGNGMHLMDGSHAGQGLKNGEGNGTRLMDGSGAGGRHGQGNGEENFVDADGDGVCDLMQS